MNPDVMLGHLLGFSMLAPTQVADLEALLGFLPLLRLW